MIVIILLSSLVLVRRSQTCASGSLASYGNSAGRIRELSTTSPANTVCAGSCGERILFKIFLVCFLKPPVRASSRGRSFQEICDYASFPLAEHRRFSPMDGAATDQSLLRMTRMMTLTHQWLEKLREYIHRRRRRRLRQKNLSASPFRRQ